jgi:hypothetical protein
VLAHWALHEDSVSKYCIGREGRGPIACIRYRKDSNHTRCAARQYLPRCVALCLAPMHAQQATFDIMGTSQVAQVLIHFDRVQIVVFAAKVDHSVNSR